MGKNEGGRTLGELCDRHAHASELVTAAISLIYSHVSLQQGNGCLLWVLEMFAARTDCPTLQEGV